MKPNAKNKWYEDINGDTSSKRFVIVGTCIAIIGLAIGVVIYGLGHKIASPDVVIAVLVEGLITKVLGMYFTTKEKVRGNNDNPK